MNEDEEADADDLPSEVETDRTRQKIRRDLVKFRRRLQERVQLLLSGIKGSGLSPPGKNQTETSLFFFSFGVDPLNWQSFIDIGGMACSTTAWCSRGHALKSILGVKL